MPYFYDPNLDEENEQQTPGEVNISGASPTTDSSGNESNAPANNDKTLNTGSGFQNLEKYLTTNQPKEFGQQVLGNVKSQVQNAGTQMQQSGEQFKDQVKSANYLPSTEQVNQAVANPSGANAQEFQGWMKEQYTGPKSLPESSDIWNKYWSGTNQAQASTKALGTEPGRFTLLDQYFGRPSYNFGEKSLDNLLVQQSGLGRETRNLQNEATQLKTKGAEEAKGLQAFAGQRANEIDQNRQNVLNTIGVDAQGNILTGANSGAIGDEYQSVYDQVKAANDARVTAQKAVRDPVGQNTLSNDLWGEFGIQTPTYSWGLNPPPGNPVRTDHGGAFTHDAFGRPLADYDTSGYKPGDQLFDLNLANYMNYGGELNRDQVMTDDQRSRIRALSNLAGVEDTFAQNEHSDPSKAYGFDSARFYADQRARAEAFSNESADLVQAYRNKQINWDTYLAQLQAVGAKYQPNRRIEKQAPPPTVSIAGEDNLSPRIRGR